MKEILKPMANDGKEPVGSMGNDTPLSVLSENQNFLHIFCSFSRRLNPPIDSKGKIL